MNDVKIVVGSNFGDEGKGLLTRHFAVDAIAKGMNPVVVFHNGTAQRGHTVDYTDDFRWVYHHFGSGTADGTPTFFAKTFWVHPMEFVDEYCELYKHGIRPKAYCDPDAPVVTPFDMLVDRTTQDHIAVINGEREFGSCCMGTWCATDRFPDRVYRVKDFMNVEARDFLLEESWKSCISQLLLRGVDVEKCEMFREFYAPNSQKKKNLIEHFKSDLDFFFSVVKLVSFDSVFNSHDSIIFENGQGLGLDKNVNNDWHTTSNTGVLNPFNMLNDKTGFNAEVCYVTRSYLTRHGVGPMESELSKNEINSDIVDRTNKPNDFQGSLRFGYLEDKEQSDRIDCDFSIVKNDRRFVKSLAVTHCNEFEDVYKKARYFSDNKFGVIDRFA